MTYDFQNKEKKMKYLRNLSLALLLSFVIAGFAFSAQIPDITQPKTGPEAWSMSVYNNSGAALDAGDIVIWDIDSSTGDNDMYVTTTTTPGTGPIAGVVKRAIGIAEEGSIVIYGVTSVDTVGSISGVGSPITTSGTIGSATSVSGAGIHTLGHSLATTSSGSTQVFVNPTQQ